MNELPKGYDPSKVEDKWYALWLAQGCFTADPSRAFNGYDLTDAQKSAARAKGLKEAYSIVIPPPNVTGMLTMGHVLNNTIQDILARRKRMQGYEVLWLPGLDHAGIATQTVVERHLRKEEKKTRHDLGREEFLKRVWEWKDKHGGIILQQLKKLGCSCDWSRTVFTMHGLDFRHSKPRINYSKWVDYVFVQLYQKGLIYRGRRMVNWCVVSRTALSDEEVNMKETKGKLWYIRYPLMNDNNNSQYLIVATTRPETMLGDTAIAVNPQDERYRSWIGQRVRLPLVGREIPIIADPAVDLNFGTGCVKVTPAHDLADFEIGTRHQLPQIQVIGFDGKMTESAGEEYSEMDRYECREKVIADLQELDLIEKIEDYTHNVGYSERADVPIEPMISEQWFLKYPAVKESLDAVINRQIAYWPDRWIKVYEHWIVNLKDWCISRQLWWGHRIPVWTRAANAASSKFRVQSSESDLSVIHPPSLKLQGTGHPESRIQDPVSRTETYVGMEAPSGEGWQQDPDVLDTWFSSWLWPFATMIPDPDAFESEIRNSKSEISIFYPTSDLVTGPDIIFLWVARMTMAGYEFMKEKPFKNVYFTGIVRDKQGRKMSKSLGNSPNPLDLIAKYGADALRFGTMRSAPLGLDVRFDEQNVELGRNFCNKLYNATRLRLSQNLNPSDGVSDWNSLFKLEGKDLSSDDKALLLRLDATISAIDQSFLSYEFNQITSKLYEFFWTHYCDWYLEASKTVLYGNEELAKRVTLAVMDYALSVILRLLHPFMPFITEELWHTLGFGKSTLEGLVEAVCETDSKSSIQFATWPSNFTEEQKNRLGLQVDILRFVEQKYEAVTVGRNLRANYNIPTSRKARFAIVSQGSWLKEEYERNVIKTLLNAESMEIRETPVSGAASGVCPLGVIYLSLEGLIDVKAESTRLQGQIKKMEKELEILTSKLSNQDFITHAPQETVEKHRSRSEQIKSDIEKIKAQIAGLG